MRGKRRILLVDLELDGESGGDGIDEENEQEPVTKMRRLDVGRSQRRDVARLKGKVGEGSKQVSGGGGGRMEHPLLNDLILRNIFQYSESTEEIKRNRLVCRAWLEASSAQWNKLTKTLTVLREDDFHALNYTCESVKSLEELQKICQSAKGPLDKVIVHQKFRFYGWTFDTALIKSLNLNKLESGSVLGPETFLWTRIAPQLITDLTLDHCQFPVDLTVFRIRFLSALPNLEKLSLENFAAKDYVIGRTIHGAPEFFHRKLKYLFVKVFKCQEHIACDLVQFLNLVPNMETVVLRGFTVSGLAKLLHYLPNPDWGRAWNNLKKLDTLDFSMEALDYGVFAWSGDVANNLSNLKVLRYDIGYDSEHGLSDLRVIQKRMQALEELHFYRAPFVPPYAEMFQSCNFLLPNITELHLWGNVVGSLDFLNLFQNLKVLVMITSCYEEKRLGQRVYQLLERRQKTLYPLMNCDLVKATKQVEKMVHLQKLEIDWIPQSAKSWGQLGQWMPSLSMLKGRIMNGSQISQIRKQWNDLESLELGHGSMISGEAVVKELVKFQRLKTFSWKSCPCTERLWKMNDLDNLEKIREAFGIDLHKRVVLPWSIELKKEFVFRNSWKRRTRNGCKVCVQAEYEKMLVSGETSEYLRMAEFFSG